MATGLNTDLIVLGRVVSTNDEKKLGRVQVTITAYGEELTSPWLRMLQPTASKKHGTLFLPEIGDEVAILRGSGDNPDGMLILGCLYGGTERVPLTPPTDDKNATKQIVSRVGHQLTFYDEGEKAGDKGHVLIATGDETLSILLDSTNAKLQLCKDQDKVLIDAPKEVSVETTETFKIPKITITVEGDAIVNAKNVTVKGSGDVAVEGKNVSVKGSMGITLEGAKVEVK